MATIEDVRQLAAGLPRSHEALVRGRVKFRVGAIVYVSFSLDGTVMGFAFPKEERDWLVGTEPEKFLLPEPSDLRFNWVLVRLAAIDAAEARELALDAWRMVVPKRVAAEQAPEAELLAWFDANGRDLPWRRTRDPYAILVSEVMAQQTQVERVVPRYLDWLARWPSVEALAAAPLADVIRAWQGLGYNRRAVNLHRAAQRIAAHGWPADLTELPGVGRYTADAVRSFALGEPVLPVDTNVARVQERTGRRFGPACGQALMDLGATVCLARVPRCGSCPLGTTCPSRGLRFEPVRKQGPLEGSFRQRRARTLRLVAAAPRQLPELDAEAVTALERDGLVRVEDRVVSLP